MSWMKGKSSGWTAFDLKQRQKQQGLQGETEDDPFPPVSTSVNPPLDVRGKLVRRNHEPSEKSFSSLLLPPSKFPALTENNKDCRSKPITLIPPVTSHDSAFRKLKEMNSWADDNLIKDVLLSTEDNFEMALDFLQGMASTGHSADKGNNEEANVPTSKMDGYSSHSRVSEHKISRRTVTSSVNTAAKSTYENAGKYGLQENGGSSFLVNAYADNEKIGSIIQRLQSIPIEPEWEEDDLYLTHRKDALKMMRSAGNHSKAAQNAFMRNVHASARQHSEKAREDWSTAEKPNAEAANKILGITNRNNDIWKLDLHGLHAAEAVQVLQERLQKIEGQFLVNRSVSPNRGMASTGHSADKGKNEEANVPTSKMDGYSSHSRVSEHKISRRTVTSSVNTAAKSTYENAGKYGLQENGGSSFLVNAYADNEKIGSIIQRLQSIPIEPEWEEDDLYLTHRKDALKMMRSAANHSKAAQNAFMRNDHASARQHSEKAREDWSTAEKLNAEAANKILGITNRNNDIWKLDLHGLHAAEAVQVLQERLHKIEGQFLVNRSVSPNRGRSKNAALRSPSQEPCGRLDVESLDHQRTSSRELRNSLQVVTGIGKHSRGHASLPLAVKTFLEDNRYRFDETRPGVITVRPKFRHS